MPIDIETFEDGDPERLGAARSQPERVLTFLAANADRAFRPSEIATALDIPGNSINAVLARLEDRNLVRHRGRYWAITNEPDRLASLGHYTIVTESLNATYGEEDPGEWVEHMPDSDEGG